MFRVFVRINHGLAFAGLDDDRDDFVGELTGFLGVFGLSLGMGGKGVLLVTGQLPFLGDVFGGGAHVIAVEGIPKAVLDHGVDHFGGAHFGAVTKIYAMWRLAHVFLATGDDDGTVADLDGLEPQGHGAQSRSAKLIDAIGGFLNWNAGADGGLAGRVLAFAGG